MSFDGDYEFVSDDKLTELYNLDGQPTQLLWFIRNSSQGLINEHLDGVSLEIRSQLSRSDEVRICQLFQLPVVEYCTM